MRPPPPRSLRTLAALVALAAVPACAAPTSGGAAPARGAVGLGPGLRVDRSAGEVVVEAAVACDRGWLEQAVCRAGTREHESLLSVDVSPSRIHAAMLLVGLRPGAPGEWRPGAGPDDAPVRVPPSGDAVELLVRHAGRDTPLAAWIADPVGGRSFPERPWVFAGSRLRALPGAGEVYVADRTGSVAGIVTFGDEPIALRDVLSDRAEVDAPHWQSRTDAMPPSGTPVQLVIRAIGAGGDR